MAAPLVPRSAGLHASARPAASSTPALSSLSRTRCRQPISAFGRLDGTTVRRDDVRQHLQPVLPRFISHQVRSPVPVLLPVVRQGLLGHANELTVIMGYVDALAVPRDFGNVD